MRSFTQWVRSTTRGSGVHRPDPLDGTATFARGSRRWFALVLAAVLVLAAFTYLTRGTSAPAAETLPSTSVQYGDVVVTVGGVGRIVPGTSAAATIELTSAGSSASPSGGSSGGTTSASPDAVFARTIGSVRTVLVKPGQRVRAGDPIAFLDDAGATAKALQQTLNDEQTARVELRRALNPLSPADVAALRLEVRRAQADLETLRGGSRAQHALALRVARRNVQAAHRQLALVLHPRTAADLAVAQADLSKAESDLADLTTPPPAPSPAALSAARSAVDAARARLAKVSGPPNPLTVSTARAEVSQAESDLAVLQQQQPPASAAELNAAQAAVDTARARLAELVAPPDPADVAAAEADLRKAEADLDALQNPSPPPTAAAVAAARLAVTAARAKVALLRRPPAPADVAAARLEVARAESDLKTLQIGPAPAALAAARSAVTSARTHLTNPTNPQDIELARLRLLAAQTQISAAQLAEDVLTVRAVHGGTVTSVLTEPGAPVDPMTPVAVVSDLGHMAASVDVSEFDAAQVRAGMRAILSVDALGGKKYAGTVVYASPTGTDSGGVVTFPVRVAFPSVTGPKAGMNVSVRIIVAERKHVLEVPLEAVNGGGDEASVKVIGPGGKVARRPVELGLSNNKSVEILDGLREGERIVLPATDAGQSDE